MGLAAAHVATEGNLPVKRYIVTRYKRRGILGCGLRFYAERHASLRREARRNFVTDTCFQDKMRGLRQCGFAFAAEIIFIFWRNFLPGGSNAKTRTYRGGSRFTAVVA